MKELYLIDGSALAYRSYYALLRNPLINSKGKDTSVVYGFISSIIRLIKEKNIEYIGVTFDLPAPTFRHKQYEKYKANRKKMPDEIKEQIPIIHDVIRAMGLPLLTKEGFEADDIMATLAQKATDNGFTTYLVTKDKDLMQLINERVFLFDINKMSVINSKNVEEKFGVEPKKVKDLLALMGDSSDNIPGIPGIGPKTALKLINEYGGFNEIFENADKISNKKLKEKIIEGKDSATLSLKLVELEYNVPIDFKQDDFLYKNHNTEKLFPLLKELEFISMLKEFPSNTTTENKTESILLDSLQKAKELVNDVVKNKSFAFDTETTGLRPMFDKLVGISISTKENIGYYLPIAHKERKLENLNEILNVLKPIFEDASIKKIGHKILFDWEFLENYGIKVNGIDFDTKIATYVLNPSQRQNSLDYIATEHLGRGKGSIKELIGEGKKQITFDNVTINNAVKYAVTDAELTFSLKNKLEKKLEQENLSDLFYNIEMPLVKVLKDIETHGVTIDPNFLNILSAKWDNTLKELTQKIYSEAKEEFNINSTQQLAVILFEKLNLKKGKKTKTGYSTNVDVLEQLAFEHELPKLILKYRSLQKLKSTYTDALVKLILPKTGRIHASFNQTVTATGRLSSSNPNLQNIPIRTEQGMEIRKAFIAPKDYLILSADYSQVELRLLAELSKDKMLIEALKNGEDIHTQTASLVFGTFPELITPEQRRQAKAVNFGVVYGISPYGLAKQIGVSNYEAKEFIDAYFENYPNIKKYMEQTVEDAKKNGYVKTIMGRKRYLPELNSSNGQVRNFAERTAINTPIQGSAADLIKMAMISVHSRIKETNLKAWMVLQVHDELVFEVHKDHAEKLKDIVKKEMENVFNLSVPLTVDIGIGNNWLDAH